jgi:hypothetical protein
MAGDKGNTADGRFPAASSKKPPRLNGIFLTLIAFVVYAYRFPLPFPLPPETAA